MTKKMTLIALVMLLADVALAAAEAHGAGDHHLVVPTRAIFWQFVNFTIFICALIYFLRKPVKDHFADRRAQFLDSANKTKVARDKAEANLAEVKTKLQLLDTTRLEQIARAEAEASDQRKQIIRDAEETAARIRNEAQKTVSLEGDRARRQIREEFVREAIAAARNVLTKDIGSQDHQKLQNDFAQRIETVRP